MAMAGGRVYVLVVTTSKGSKTKYHRKHKYFSHRYVKNFRIPEIQFRFICVVQFSEVHVFLIFMKKNLHS